jgi:hypothetical protein
MSSCCKRRQPKTSKYYTISPDSDNDSAKIEELTKERTTTNKIIRNTKDIVGNLIEKLHANKVEQTLSLHISRKQLKDNNYVNNSARKLTALIAEQINLEKQIQEAQGNFCTIQGGSKKTRTSKRLTRR